MTSIIGSYINSTISRVVKFMIELLFKTSKRAQHTSQRWTRRQLQQATSRWQDRWTSEQGKEGELGGALVKLNPHDPNVAVPPVKELSRPAHLIGRPAVICPINPCLRGSVMLGSTSVLFTRSQVCQQSVLPVFFFFMAGTLNIFMNAEVWHWFWECWIFECSFTGKSIRWCFSMLRNHCVGYLKPHKQLEGICCLIERHKFKWSVHLQASATAVVEMIFAVAGLS